MKGQQKRTQKKNSLFGQSRPASLRDVAAAAGVSVAAASYALNERPGEVGHQARARILAAARRLDYHPNGLMRAVRTRRTRVIGVLVPSIQSGFFPAIIDGIEGVASAAGCQIVICQTNMQPDRTAREIAMLRERRVDGFIATPMFRDNTVYERLGHADQNLVLIDYDLKGVPIPAVRSDDLRGADLAVSHLIRLGRRRIATLLHPRADFPARLQLRFQGYRQALRRAGIAFDPQLALEVGWEITEGEELVRRLLRERIDFDAVFAPSDMAAIGAMLALREAGRRVPDDVAVVGYCNLREGQHLTPPLTTVNQHPELIGRTAAQLILDRIAGKAPETAKVHWIEPELIVRESCGAGRKV